MHQRRRAADSSGTPSRLSHHGSSQLSPLSNRSRSPNHDRFAVFSTLIWLFLLVMVGIEFIAYKSLDIATPTAHAPNEANQLLIPNKQPTGTRITFEPTTAGKGRHLKMARLESHRNSFYWKTRDPDKVPPLPPDVDEHGKALPPVVAYVVTLTKCDESTMRSIDGAAVLLHSIRRNSYGWTPLNDQMQNADAREVESDVDKWPEYGGQGGRYRYRAYAFVDPATSPDNPSLRSSCAKFLRKLGYVILHRPPLVPLFPITPENFDMSGGNEFFQQYKKIGYVGSHRTTVGPLARIPYHRPDIVRRKIHDDGCCGYSETLKLHVYGMVEHPIAVHLDLDSIVLRPMDDLFDAMLGKTDGRELPIAKGPKTKPLNYTRPIDAAFTRDYNSLQKPKEGIEVGYQGGFLAVRPSLKVLERFRNILLHGEYVLKPKPNRGWGGKYGAVYGGFTIQGLLPYYYEMIAPDEHNEIELNRCIYNQMGDNPHATTAKFPRATPLDAKSMGYKDTDICRDGRDDCSDTDCQRTHPKDTVTAHFTFCKKPWDCSEGLPGTVAISTCRGLLHEWFAIRRELEDWWLLLGKTLKESSYWKNETISAVKEQRSKNGLHGHYNGYCQASGDPLGYFKMIEPDEPKGPCNIIRGPLAAGLQRLAAACGGNCQAAASLKYLAGCDGD